MSCAGNNNRLYVTLTVVFLYCGCSGSHTGKVNQNSVTWMQTSEEYCALSVGAYHMAGQNLNHALTDKTWMALLSQAPANSDEAHALGQVAAGRDSRCR